MQNFCFCQLSMQIWWRRRCSRVVDLKLPIRRLRQRRHRPQRERHLIIELCVSAIISQLFKVIALAKCVLTILEWNWNQRFWDNKTKLNICHHILTLSTQLQNRSFRVVERTRTSAFLRNAEKWRMHVQSVQNYCFSSSNMQISDVLVTVVIVVA